MSRIQVLGNVKPEFGEILTPEALSFLADLAREFEPTRRALIRARYGRQADIDMGHLPDFLPETRRIRESNWQVPPAPQRPDQPAGGADRPLVHPEDGN